MVSFIFMLPSALLHANEFLKDEECVLVLRSLRNLQVLKKEENTAIQYASINRVRLTRSN